MNEISTTGALIPRALCCAVLLLCWIWRREREKKTGEIKIYVNRSFAPLLSAQSSSSDKGEKKLWIGPTQYRFARWWRQRGMELSVCWWMSSLFFFSSFACSCHCCLHLQSVSFINEINVLSNYTSLTAAFSLVCSNLGTEKCFT